MRSVAKATLRRLSPAVICGIAAVLVSPAGAQTAAPQILAQQTAAFECKAPPEFVRLDQPLRHTARRLAADEPLTIVAIGSSSTWGAGASSPAASYPSRLAAELGKRLPRDDVTVLNRGVNPGKGRTETHAVSAPAHSPPLPLLLLC